MSLRNIVQHITERMGIDLEPSRTGDPPSLFRLRTRVRCTNLDLSERILATRKEHLVEAIHLEIQHAQRVLFHDLIEHIAKHDRDPLDRVAALEKHARQLIDELGSRVHDDSGTLGNAVRQLERLLVAKPGAASWWRDGYGKDQPR